MLALIPAKQNSTRLKNKNLKLLNGKPLIYYSISYFKIKIYFSSNCFNRLKNNSKKSLAFGAEVPFIRPKIFQKQIRLLKMFVIMLLSFGKKRKD